MSAAAGRILGHFLAVVIAAATAAGPFAASQPATATRTRDPFRQLFPVDRAPGSLRRDKAIPPALNAPKTDVKIVCGLTVYRVTPEADARMVMKAPEEGRTSFAIRRIAPSVCAEDAVPLSK